MKKTTEAPQLQDIDDITLSEACCAKLFHTYFPNRFRYEGNNRWQYYDTDHQMWVPDKGKKQLKKCIRADFCSILLERAKQWQDYAQHLPCPDHDVSFRIVRFMELAQKLHTEEFLRNVFREITEWYNVEM